MDKGTDYINRKKDAVKEKPMAFIITNCISLNGVRLKTDLKIVANLPSLVYASFFKKPCNGLV